MCASACGSVSVGTVDPGADVSASENTGEVQSRVYAFATDYTSGGQVFVASLADNEIGVSNSGLAYLGSSAIIRVYDGLLYVLHDGFSTVSNDNVQVVDPGNGFATLAQYSTGNGTNPHDVVVTGGHAFISLYNPSADPDNVDASGNPGDVIEMDLSNGQIVNRFSFHDDLQDDGDLNANADQMALVGGKLYVALQDLEATTFKATAPAKLGVIDTTTGEKGETIALQGRNPVGLAASGDGRTLAVAHMATYDTDTGDFSLAPEYGGLELVDLESGTTRAFLKDEDLGGYVERVESDTHEFYAVVSDFDAVSFAFTSRVLALPQTASAPEDALKAFDDGSDIREIAVQNAYLWVSSRKMNSHSGLAEPRLDVIDLFTVSPAASEVALSVPGMSLVSAE